MAVKFPILPFLALTILAPLFAEKFYPDDPVWEIPKPISVGRLKPRKLNDYYDFFRNTFARPGERQPCKGNPIRAGAVNTLDEVPDSSWYTNRHGRRRMSIEELMRGPDRDNQPSIDGPWRIVSAKTEGVTPGFSFLDSKNRRYFLKFDPITNPEMATAADVIGSKFFYALGYNVPENYLVFFDRNRLVVDPKTTFVDAFGKRRRMSERDVDETLRNVPRGPDGQFRAVASLVLPGEYLGEFRYDGTRKDDPNDTVPHEHRRDLRGLFVFCAWLGHDDSRAINTLDFLVEENGVRFVKHHLIDFGSILGSASTKSNSARSGNEYLFSWKPSLIQLFTLGLYVPDWARRNYDFHPAVGLFEGEEFDPEKYRTEYPNPAFLNRLPDDTYWAAKKVMAFTDDDIRAIVKTGKYSDPRAEQLVARALIRRRDKIGKTYFTRVLALDNFVVSNGKLEFEDLAVKHEFVPPRSYEIRWSVFDNEQETRTPLPESGASIPRVEAAYLAADISSGNPKQSVTVYLRQSEPGWTVVGIERRW